MHYPFERVYTIDDWYDGARFGAADYQGAAYVYRSLYLDSDTWDPKEDRFELAPISNDVLGWMTEAAELHQRWYRAYRAGQLGDAPEDAPRVLPQDAGRYEDLERLIASALACAAPRFIVRGEFEYESGLARVRWRPLEATRQNDVDTDHFWPGA